MKIIAPLSGLKIDLAQVPDPVFAQKMVGDGAAIDPTDQILRSPIDGKVVQLHASHHAITIAASNGQEVLMHIGIDTVKLKGQGFTPKVRQGETVKAGQPLIEFDADFIAQQAKSLITMILVPNAEKLTLLNESFLLGGKSVLFELSSSIAANKTSMAQTSTEKQNAESAPVAESAPIKINLPTGIHARPAALLAGMAKNYQSEIQIVKGALSGNAKSVVSLLSMEIGYGDHLRFLASGTDAQKAVAEISELLEDMREAPPTVSKPQVKRSRSQDPNVLTGVGISPGLAIGKVYQVKAENFQFQEDSTTDIDTEKSFLQAALAKATTQLSELMAQVKNQTDASRAAIFAAHRELLEDPDLHDLAHTLISQGKGAAFAWSTATEDHARRLSQLNNELLANRANDLRDVARRVLRLLAPSQQQKSTELSENSILIAENLTPSETVQLDRNKVVGFCTTGGGATSHVAILARSLGLPALAGTEDKVLQIPDGTEVVLDGESGELRLQPTEQQRVEVQRQQNANTERRQAALALAHQPAVTRDGQRIEVAANIGGVADAREAIELGADGVGLLRSEFLFLERDHAPSEDEQLAVYQEIADLVGHRTLVIRTLDVGGDKPLRYLPMPAEENPFLGVRGIRIGLAQPEILRTQLRAILRVKSQAKMHIMFPMISTLEEWREAKEILEQEREALKAAPVAVGIMVEVPSTALMAEVFAKEVDFFSIGTNDLTQYTLAMDRGHKDLAKQVDALHPSVLKLIELTAQAANKYGKWVGVCGGLASDLNAVGILLGLGVRELSVSLPSIPLVKSRVRESALPEAESLAAQALIAENGEKVRELEKKLHESLNNPWQGLKHVDSDRKNDVFVSPENR